MNARQKAKRFKRLYEDLLKQTPPIVFEEPHQIDTLRVERMYPEELVRNTCFMQEDNKPLFMKDVTDFISSIATPIASAYIQKDISYGLAEGLYKYIVYRTDYNPEMNTYRICGEIKVVVI